MAPTASIGVTPSIVPLALNVCDKELESRNQLDWLQKSTVEIYISAFSVNRLRDDDQFRSLITARIRTPVRERFNARLSPASEMLSLIPGASKEPVW
jgi:hypothetical protein